MQKLKLLDLKKSSGLAHQLRQLVDIGRNPSRFIAGERLGCRFELRPRLAALKPFQSAFEFFGASSRHGKITSASIQTCGAAGRSSPLEILSRPVALLAAKGGIGDHDARRDCPRGRVCLVSLPVFE